MNGRPRRTIINTASRLSFAIIATMIGAVGIGDLGAQQPAQRLPRRDSQAPVFRAEVNYVDVDVVVTDAQGHPVTNLTQGDFEILEESKPQKISSFSVITLPVEHRERPLSATRPTDIDVHTNARSEGRIYLFVLDDLHTDAAHTSRVAAAARRFIEEDFGDNDVAAVVFTGGVSTQLQDFTSNPALLIDAIDRFHGQKLPSPTVNRLNNRLDVDVDAIERPRRARLLITQLRAQSELLSRVRGRRKAIILVSEGIDGDVKDAVAAATRANVAIYAIDPRGATTATEDLGQLASVRMEGGTAMRLLSGEDRRARNSLNVLAAETGGFAATNTNGFDTAFDRIAVENSSYYLLGFYPAIDRRDGRIRRLQVRVKRPGLTVRARNGYIAPRAEAPPPNDSPTALLTRALLSAVTSPLPVSGIPMKVFAAAFKQSTPPGSSTPRAAIALAVELDISKLEFASKDGNSVETLQVVTAPTDSSRNNHQWDTRDVMLSVKPEALAAMRSRGIRVLTSIDLAPGRYQLRVAAGDAGGKTGSVICDVDVPDYARVPFAISGIAMTSLSASEVTTVRAADPLAEFLPGPLSATREFTAGDVITTYAEVYENRLPTPLQKLSVKTQLLKDGDRLVWQTEEELSPTEVDGGSGRYQFSARIPLSGIATGLYIVRLEAHTGAGDGRTVSRNIQIRVKEMALRSQ